MSKQWIVAPAAPVEFQDNFPELSRVTQQLLYNRHIIEPERVERFLSPEYQQLHSPFLFQDMEKCIDRIWQAVENNEKIVVYGDYDADAVTANAVLQQTFRYLNFPVQSYIPDRFTEGYGLNVEAFAKLKADGVTLAITVDCGTNSVDVAEYCKANDIDLIITDHHEITGETPDAYALVNPKNPSDLYPDDQITGVGVAYKLAKGILSDTVRVLRQKQISESELIEEWDKWLLDLVAIGTVADCHSLLGENRILVKFGLRVLPKTKWLGLRQLMENAGMNVLDTAPDSRTLGFVIAPRINAAGRLEHANIALDLLLATDFAAAITLSNRLEEVNRRRQDMTARIVSQAKEQAELILDRKVLLVSHEEWPKGLVGIVAGKLAEQYKKPVLVLEKGEMECTGSARTSGEFDMVACLKSASAYLVKFGGHKQAAGLTVSRQNLDVFYEAILKFADENPAPQQVSQLSIETYLRENEISMETYDAIAQLEPYGVGNQKPLFGIQNAQVVNYRLVGSNQNHLQLQVMIGGKILDCIGFNQGYRASSLEPGVLLDIAGELIVDAWNGNKRLKFKLTDFKTHEAA